MRVVFMGTPEFAANCLQYLLEKGVNVVGVVTMPDKPAGRGRQIFESPVKRTALAAQIPILQPASLKDETFRNALSKLQPDLQIVVAFRMLPESVWNLPPLGTYNLHASILPQYRGAAPINWALINGDKKTGVSFFKLKHEIDTGDVLDTTEVEITNDMNAGELHDLLCEKGKQLIYSCIQKIATGQFELRPQNAILTKDAIKEAPKLNKINTEIHWSKSAAQIHNLVRGLSPYPSAWTKLQTSNTLIEPVKIFQTSLTNEPSKGKAGSLRFHNGLLQIATGDCYLNVHTLQIPGKAKVDGKSFWNGLKDKESTSFVSEY